MSVYIRGFNSTSTRAKDFLEVGEHVWERCDTTRALLRRGCAFDRLEDTGGPNVLPKYQEITFLPEEQRQQRQHSEAGPPIRGGTKGLITS